LALATVNFAIQDLLRVDFCVLVPFRPTTFAGDRDWFSVLRSGLLFDDIHGLGTAFEVRDVLGGFGAKLCFGFLDGFRFFEAQNEVCSFVCVLRGAEDLVLVILKRLDPRSNVGGVLFGVVRNAPLRGKEDTRQLGAQLFLGVVRIAESVALIEGWAVQASGVAAPVGKLMQSRSVVVRRAPESVLLWKMDRILRAAVESTI